jgi:hypothetical protein
MRKPSGAEYTLDCHEEQLLLSRKKGKGPVKAGQKFRRVSKLDGSVYYDTLVGFVTVVGLKVLSTWRRGIFKSDAAGINPVQRMAALRRDAEQGLSGVDYDPKTGEAIFSSRGAYKRYCEANALFDRNGGHGAPCKRDNREREILGLPLLPEPEAPQLA